MSIGRFVPVVGLVGGVGSGKTAVCHRLRAERQIVIVDGDAAGHAVLADPSIKEELRRVLGDSIFDDRGDVDRRALGRLVFGSSAEHRRARARLEQIVHPEIRKRLEAEIARAGRQDDVEAILLDAAVLYEAGWDDLCDAVVFIDVPFETRRKRVHDERSWTKDQLADREASQFDLATKRRKADFVIRNDALIDDAAESLGQIVEWLVRARGFKS